MPHYCRPPTAHRPSMNEITATHTHTRNCLTKQRCQRNQSPNEYIRINERDRGCAHAHHAVGCHSDGHFDPPHQGGRTQTYVGNQVGQRSNSLDRVNKASDKGIAPVGLRIRRLTSLEGSRKIPATTYALQKKLEDLNGAVVSADVRSAVPATQSSVSTTVAT